MRNVPDLEPVVADPPQGTRDANGRRGMMRQMREWRFQAIGRALACVLIVVAATGVLGGVEPLTTLSHAIVVFFVLIALMRVTGRRSVGEMSPFDLILLLMVSESAQESLIVGDDETLATALMVICTFFVLDFVFAWVTQRSRVAEELLEGGALVIVHDGRPLRARMRREHVTEGEVLAKARQAHGLVRMDQIRFAVLECDGSISIVPKKE